MGIELSRVEITGSARADVVEKQWPTYLAQVAMMDGKSEGNQVDLRSRIRRTMCSTIAGVCLVLLLSVLIFL